MWNARRTPTTERTQPSPNASGRNAATPDAPLHAAAAAAAPKRWAAERGSSVWWWRAGAAQLSFRARRTRSPVVERENHERAISIASILIVSSFASQLRFGRSLNVVCVICLFEML